MLKKEKQINSKIWKCKTEREISLQANVTGAQYLYHIKGIN